MNITKKLSFTKLALGTLGVSLMVGAIAATSMMPSENVLRGEATASWVSNAETVKQQVMESDLVVRVQVLGQDEPRHLWHPTPEGAEPGRFVFTDSEVEVLQVYRGDVEVGDRLKVMQTGGQLITREGKLTSLQLREDPIYEVGSEMVLFLVDISGDSVHAPERELYRTVNPAGRYEIEGSFAGRRPMGEQVMGRELDLFTLEAEIAQAIEDRNAAELF